MNWKPPATEAEWEECLSAYADGELDRDSAAALETHLKSDAKRAQQLEALQETSAILQAWTVDAPAPSAELRASLTKQRTRSSFNNGSKGVPILHGGMLRLAAAFAVGVLAGGWLVGLNRSTTSNPPPATTVRLSPPVVAGTTVPQERAIFVFKEVEAAALTQRIQQAARDGHWKNAVEGLERMEAQYAETEAAGAFAKGSMAQQIFRHTFRGRS